jgi:hypothetical protein
MFNKTMITISVAIALDTASGAFAAPVQVASNKSPQYSSPDSTPNGPFFYVETLGVPPKALLPPRQPRRSAHSGVSRASSMMRHAVGPPRRLLPERLILEARMRNRYCAYLAFCWPVDKIARNKMPPLVV